MKEAEEKKKCPQDTKGQPKGPEKAEYGHKTSTAKENDYPSPKDRPDKKTS